MSELLSQLISELAAGRLRIVDLTQPLSARRLRCYRLPAQWNNTPPFSLKELSRYDERGPAWYWNAFETGEHTGTHFDAPVHWISGKDLPNNTVDRIPPAEFVGPACVVDVTQDVARDPNFLVTPELLHAWEKTNGKIPASRVGIVAHRMVEAYDCRGLHQYERRRPAHSRMGARQRQNFSRANAMCSASEWKQSAPTQARPRELQPPFPNHFIMHGSGKFGLAGLCNLDQLPATGAVVIAAPLKIVGGSGSPLRVIAITP